MHGLLSQVDILIHISFVIKIIVILTIVTIIVISIIRLTRYGRDGANYTSRATFDCYYDPENSQHVIIDYQV